MLMFEKKVRLRAGQSFCLVFHAHQSIDLWGRKHVVVKGPAQNRRRMSLEIVPATAKHAEIFLMQGVLR